MTTILVRNTLSDLTRRVEQCIIDRLKDLSDNDMDRLESILIDPVNDALDDFEDFVDHRRSLWNDEND